MNQRLEVLQNWLEAEGYDLAFVHTPANVFYLTGFWCEPHERVLGLLVSPQSPPILICPQLEKNRVIQLGWEHGIVAPADTDDPWRLLSESLGDARASSLAVEKNALSLAWAEHLRLIFPAVSFTAVDRKLEAMRAVKDPVEAELLRQAALLADEAVAAGVAALREGVSELEVAAVLELAMKRRGVTKMSFPTLVLFGANAADPHGETGDSRLKPGDLVLFDLGVVWKGYCSDISRTVAFRIVGEKQRAVYEAVLRGQEAALAAAKPGLRMGEVDLAARNSITQAGYGEFFVHRVGHGLGLMVHEYPSMHQDNDDFLQVGMAFTIEPGIYLPGQLGVRIEDDVLVTPRGVEVLTKYPKELQII